MPTCLSQSSRCAVAPGEDTGCEREFCEALQEPAGPGARRRSAGHLRILHVVKTGCRWCDGPPAYGPPTTIDNRFNRWSRHGVWKARLAALAKAGWNGEASAIDATDVRAHRSAQDGKGGQGTRHRALAWRPDHQDPRAHRRCGPPGGPPSDARPCQRRQDRPGCAGRGARPHPAPDRRRRQLAAKGFDRAQHHAGHPRNPRASTQDKDSCWIATRYDKLARNLASALALAAFIAFWP